MNQGPAADTTELPRLLEASARGDAAAFSRLYEATASKLYGIVLRITMNRAIAEEVLQETYVKIWQNAERYLPEAGQPFAWLAAIARNRAIDRIRSERFDRFRHGGDDDFWERLPAPTGDDPAMRESLRTCLSELDEDAQRCVLLAYCSGYSREELAQRFGRPVGTIKTLLHRSIRALRNCLDRE